MGLKDIRNFDYAVLLCQDVAAMRAFYRDVMGFALIHDQPGWVRFQVGATLLTLRPRGPGPLWGDDGPGTPGSASVQLAFRVPPAALQECHDDLVEKGVTIGTGPSDLPAWRHRVLFFRDPEDNIIEIYAEI